MSTTPSAPTPPRPCRTCSAMTHNKGQRCDTCAPIHRKQHNTDTAHYRTPAWRRLRTFVLNRDYQQCIICASTQRLAVHHIVARKAGGEDTPTNLATLCTSCHTRLEAGSGAHAEALQRYMRTIDAI